MLIASSPTCTKYIQTIIRIYIVRGKKKQFAEIAILLKVMDGRPNMRIILFWRCKSAEVTNCERDMHLIDFLL